MLLEELYSARLKGVSVLLRLGYAVYYFTRLSFTYVGLAMRSDLGLSMVQLGAISSLFPLAYMLLGLNSYEFISLFHLFPAFSRLRNARKRGVFDGFLEEFQVPQRRLVGSPRLSSAHLLPGPHVHRHPEYRLLGRQHRAALHHDLGDQRALPGLWRHLARL